MTTTTFLTFVGDNCGKTEEAINFYISLFPNSGLEEIHYYKEGEMGGSPGLVKYAVFTLNGKLYMASENTYKHAWTFSPGVSIFIKSNSEVEVRSLFEKLGADGGQVMVPLEDYGTAEYGLGRLFGWCEDRYGISWQLTLED